MSMLTIRPTATRPYSKSLAKVPMSPIATEADVVKSAQELVTSIDLKVDGSGGTFIPPTSDPLVAGAIWNNSGTLAISVG